MGAMVDLDLQGTVIELRYILCMAGLDNVQLRSLVGVGTVIGRGFQNTKELKVMNYKEAMNSEDATAQKEEVRNEKKQFDKSKVLTVVPRGEMPKGTKAMTTTWEVKKKPSFNEYYLIDVDPQPHPNLFIIRQSMTFSIE